MKSSIWLDSQAGLGTGERLTGPHSTEHSPLPEFSFHFASFDPQTGSESGNGKWKEKSICEVKFAVKFQLFSEKTLTLRN